MDPMGIPACFFSVKAPVYLHVHRLLFWWHLPHWHQGLRKCGMKPRWGKHNSARRGGCRCKVMFCFNKWCLKNSLRICFLKTIKTYIYIYMCIAFLVVFLVWYMWKWCDNKNQPKTCVRNRNWICLCGNRHLCKCLRTNGCIYQK